MYKQNDGFLKILILVVLALMVFGGYVVLSLSKEKTLQEQKPKNNIVEFVDIPEDETTPDIINNKVVDELDTIMMELSEMEEDLSDLAL